MLGEHEWRQAWEQDHRLVASERDALAKKLAAVEVEVQKHIDSNTDLKAALNGALMTLTMCKSSLISYDTTMRVPNPPMTYELGRKIRDTLLQITSSINIIHEKLR